MNTRKKKRCSKSLLIRGLQSKTTLRGHLTRIRVCLWVGSQHCCFAGTQCVLQKRQGVGGSRALGNMDHQEQRGCNVAQGVPKLAQTWPISVIGALTGSRAPVGGRGGGWGRGLERAQTWVMIAGRSAHAYFWGWFWLLGYFSRAVLANVTGSSRDFTHIPALTEAQPLP